MTLTRALRGLAGLLIVAALIVQYALLLGRMNGDIGAATLRFFNYFTLLSNMVGAAAFLFPAAAPGSTAGRFFDQPAMRTAAALYLLVVGAVYHAILASRWDPQGWQLAADIVLHTLAPLAMLIDWIVLTAKRGLALTMIPRTLFFPLAYGLWALAIGAATGFYPYPFLDVTALGYANVSLNLAILLAIFAALGAAMVVIGRRLPAAAQR
jgi:hypothetical protein